MEGELLRIPTYGDFRRSDGRMTPDDFNSDNFSPSSPHQWPSSRPPADGADGVLLLPLPSLPRSCCRRRFTLHHDRHTGENVRAVYALLVNIGAASRFMIGYVVMKIYTTYVRPKLEYSISLWNPYLKKHIDNLERVKEKCTTRMEPDLAGVGYEEWLKILVTFRKN